MVQGCDVPALLFLLEKRGHVETRLEYRDGTHGLLRWRGAPPAM